MDLHDPSPRGEMAEPALDEVTEVSFLLPEWQMALLESAAHDRGMTTAQVVRRLVRDFVNRVDDSCERLQKQDAAYQW
jgi:hypothetical protein